MKNVLEFIFEMMAICSGLSLEQILHSTPLELEDYGIKGEWVKMFDGLEECVMLNTPVEQLLDYYGDN